jgi:hypothetical protein
MHGDTKADDDPVCRRSLVVGRLSLLVVCRAGLVWLWSNVLGCLCVLF